MIYEKRTYRVRPGTAAEFLKIYEDEGLGIITKYAKLCGCWVSESGTLNAVVFLWGYDDFGHRAAQRAKLGSDADWKGFVPKILPFLDHQESVFLQPAAFSPLK